MRRTTRHYAYSACVAGFAGAAACLGWITATSAATPFDPPNNPNQVQVVLVRQDQSDCQNSDVKNVDSALVGGTASVTRSPDGKTNVQVAITAKPNTTYNFYLKCVRQLGSLRTGDEGTAAATFTFDTNTAGNVFAFDMYPDGAPAGNKFQSAQVAFR